jgi:hypothetical protein
MALEAGMNAADVSYAAQPCWLKCCSADLLCLLCMLVNLHCIACMCGRPVHVFRVFCFSIICYRHVALLAVAVKKELHLAGLIAGRRVGVCIGWTVVQHACIMCTYHVHAHAAGT